MIPWTTITNFGDSAVMLPAAVAIALWLAAGGAWRATAAWLLSFGAGAGLVAATKIAFMGWGVGCAAVDFTGISGHTMLATSVTLTSIHLLTNGMRRQRRQVLYAAGLVAALSIGLSRLALECHSVSEVCAGLAIGGLVAAGFAAVTRDLPPPRMAPGVMAAALVLICMALHGHQAASQDLIMRVALYLSGHAEPYTRAVYGSGII